MLIQAQEILNPLRLIVRIFPVIGISPESSQIESISFPDESCQWYNVIDHSLSFSGQIANLERFNPSKEHIHILQKVHPFILMFNKAERWVPKCFIR